MPMPRSLGHADLKIEPPIPSALLVLFFSTLAAFVLFPMISSRDRLVQELTWSTTDRLYLELLYHHDPRPEVGERLLRLYLTHDDLPAACHLLKKAPVLLDRPLPRGGVMLLRDCFFAQKEPDPFFKERLIYMARKSPSLQLAEVLTQVGLFRHALKLYERLFATAPQRQKPELLKRIVRLHLALDEPERAFLAAKKRLTRIEAPTPELYRLMVKVALMAGKPELAACYAYPLVFEGKPPCGGR